MSMPLLFFAIDIATIALSAMFGARVLAGNPRLKSAQLLALIAFCNIGAVVLGRQDYGSLIPAAYRFDVGILAPVLNVMRNLSPGLFMVWCFLQFTDERRFPRWLLALFALQVAIEVPVRWIIKTDWHLMQVAQVAPATLEGVFGGVALYWTLATWRDDLIESRRRARALVAAIIAVYIIASCLLPRVVIDPGSMASYWLYEALAAGDLAIVALIFLRFGDDYLGLQLDLAHPVRAERAVMPRAIDPMASQTLGRLNKLLEEERVYRRPSLSLAELAKKAGVPEYRLRKTINEELGYPNFNAFLHSYRINDACRQLRDPAMARIPILTIALSVGYQSVNTFNRGFRSIMGMTPSAFRAADEPAEQAGATQKVSPEAA
ncbi:MAG TPA: helix-turn-helix transcriptional regulator [Rhizomicrobium sp.]|jgi:AraC-like DNA-binding protein